MIVIALLIVAAMIVGAMIATSICADNMTFYRRLSARRGCEIIELRSEICRLKRKLGEPEDLLHG